MKELAIVVIIIIVIKLFPYIEMIFIGLLLLIGKIFESKEKKAQNKRIKKLKRNRVLDIGKEFEKEVEKELQKIPEIESIFPSIILRNQSLTRFTECDFIACSKKAIYFLECKSYNGTVEISTEKYWKNIDTKEFFYSPVRQNEGHVSFFEKNYSDIYNNNIPIYSIVIFDDRTTLIDNPTNVENSKVIKYCNLKKQIKDIEKQLITEHDMSLLQERFTLELKDSDMYREEQIRQSMQAKS